MARILILIGGHLCTAPRPQKEAAALVAAGHHVTIAGVWFDPVLVERDRTLIAHQPWTFQPVLDFRPGRWSCWGVRLQAKLARLLFRHVRYHTPALLGYGARSLLHFAQRFQADLTIVHSEAGLWVGSQLLKQDFQVGVDFEDWFSQDLLPEAQRDRPVAWIAELETQLNRACHYRITTSQALATALAIAHQVTPPTVVYNVFPVGPRPVREGGDRPIRLHWFSQTIGPGRGLETLFAALSHVETPIEIHLRGAFSSHTQTWIAAQVPNHWLPRIHLHSTVPNPELPARIAAHDIGLALEQPTPPSRNLTITNKLFQYLQAGLAIIATDTAGQQEILHQIPTAGTLIPPSNPQALATAINHLTTHPTRLQQTQTAARHAAETRFKWEIERVFLVLTAERALNTPPTHLNQIPFTPAKLNLQPSHRQQYPSLILTPPMRSD